MNIKGLRKQEYVVWSCGAVLFLVMVVQVVAAVSTPTNFQATALSSSLINISWTYTPNDAEGFILGDDFGFISLWDGALRSYLYATCPSRSWTFTLKSFSGMQQSAPAGPLTVNVPAGPPSPPTNFRVQSTTANQINLRWESIPCGGTAYSLKLERSTQPTSGFSQIVILNGGESTYSDTVSTGTVYYYRLQAYNAQGNLGYTPVVSAGILPPPTPVDVQARLSGAAVLFQWRASNALNFTIERSTQPTSGFSVVGTLNAAGSEFGSYEIQNTPPSVGVTYYYRVKATNMIGSSPYTQSIGIFYGAPTAPTNLHIMSVTSQTVHLRWEGISNEDGVIIERALGGGSFTQIGTTSGPGYIYYRDSGLVNGQTYQYKVKAYNGVGQSAYSNSISAVPTPAQINTPSQLIITRVYPHEIDLNWSATLINNEGETYIIERAPTSGGPWTDIAHIGPDTFFHADTLLNPSTAYYYRIRAAKFYGYLPYREEIFSGYTSVVGATTSVAPTIPDEGGTRLFVFTYPPSPGAPVPSYILDHLCNANGPENAVVPATGFLKSIDSWVKREANKYGSGKPYNSMVCLRDNQVLLPSSVILGDVGGSYFLNQGEVISYLENNAPAAVRSAVTGAKYVTIYHYVPSGNTFPTSNAAGDKYSFVYFLSSFYDQEFTVNHEFMHNLGATDKYDIFGLCLIDPATSREYRGIDIMCGRIILGNFPVGDDAAGFPAGFSSAIATLPTAQEVGWAAGGADGTSPQFSNAQVTPPSPSTYQASGTYLFSITWTDDTSVQHAFLTFNGTNYSMTQAGNTFSTTLPARAAGDYVYRFGANDSAGNSNQTIPSIYTVTKASSALTLLFNGAADNISVQVSQQVNASCSSTPARAVTLSRNGIDVSATELHRNVSLPLGMHQYQCTVGATQNYTSLSVNAFVNVTPIIHELTVNKNGGGTGSVSSVPVGINCGGQCTAPFEGGTMVTLTATPSPGSVFIGWGGACSGTGICTVTMDMAKSVTATFEIQPTSLTINKAGTGTGSVTSAPAGINCGAQCSAFFTPGSRVNLSAAPAANSIFGGWSAGVCTGTKLSCNVTMDASMSVTATFTLTQPQSHTLSVTKAGSGSGTVTSSPTGIDCGGQCDASFDAGTMVTLSANPAVNSTFAGWGGACSGTGICTVTMNAAQSVSAQFTFVPQTFALTVNKAGTGSGSITSSPTGIDCGTTCAASFASGAIVTLTPAPVAGSSFTGWSGACSGTGTCSVTMDMAKSVTATFTLQQFTLTVTKNGGGTGSVSSVPAGINCGAQCSASFDFNTVVTVTATANGGSSFSGWGEDAAGCGTQSSCSMTMDAARSASATFTLTQAPFASPIPGLIARWTFDGTFLDSSGNNNHATPLNGASRVTLTGSDEAAEFDGVNDYLSVAHSQSLAVTNGLSISLWAQPRSGTNNGLIFKGTLTNSQGVFALAMGGSYIWRLNGEADVYSTSAPSYNAWTHIVATYGDGEQRIYINGALQGSVPYTTPLTANTDGLYLGIYYASPYVFDGRMNNVMLFNRSLTASEVAQLYTNPSLTAPAHPADNNTDFQMSFLEFSDYNRAYKLQESWLTPPSPPTISYYTRALLLYKRGGTYFYNQSVTCPICWLTS